MGDRAFAFSQPPVVQILVISSFLFLLNGVRVVADYLLYAGVVAEVFLGMIFGAPLANILQLEWESTFGVLGYMGLICIVFEGGLSTNLPILLENLLVSFLCALMGVIFPIGLSIALLYGGFGYAPLEAFAAGAALCSTSLGTTLAVLGSVSRTVRTSNGDPSIVDKGRTTDERSDGPSQEEPAVILGGAFSSSMHHHTPDTTDIQRTRIGTILTGAAIIDDVLGLVIAAFIPALSTMSETSRSLQPWQVIRPLLSSTLIVLVTPLIARYGLRPMFWFRTIGERWCSPKCGSERWAWQHIIKSDNSSWGTQEHADYVKLCISILTLGAAITIAYYTDSSMLLGAYVAGLVLSYVCLPPQDPENTSPPEGERDGSTASDMGRRTALSFELSWQRTVGPITHCVLAPLFFASIGYAIPFLSLWKGEIIWRGILYSSLMAAGKLAAGFPVLLCSLLSIVRARNPHHPAPAPQISSSAIDEQDVANDNPRQSPALLNPGPWPERQDSTHPRVGQRKDDGLLQQIMTANVLAPAAFLGTAMISRGEIGLLIAQIAHHGSSTGDGLLGEELFLICIWAILVCTVVGPICAGAFVRRWGRNLARDAWS